jgi:hypothetical protein
LSPFIAAGTITQAMLTDPNTLLRNHFASQNIIISTTTTIFISTSPATPLFGGGTDNIAFLLGNAAATAPNAQSLKTVTFWIETVEHVIVVPIFKPGQPPLSIPVETGDAGQPVPKFLVNPPIEITTPRSITVKSTQIQYSQRLCELQRPHLAARLRGYAGAERRHPGSALRLDLRMFTYSTAAYNLVRIRNLALAAP